MTDRHALKLRNRKYNFSSCLHELYNFVHLMSSEQIANCMLCTNYICYDHESLLLEHFWRQKILICIILIELFDSTVLIHGLTAMGCTRRSSLLLFDILTRIFIKIFKAFKRRFLLERDCFAAICGICNRDKIVLLMQTWWKDVIFVVTHAKSGLATNMYPVQPICMFPT